MCCHLQWIWAKLVTFHHHLNMHEKETVGAVRNGHYRTMCLPVNKYIKWNSGKRALSFVVITNILREVAINGGDWAYALEKHIPMFV